jgi:hypothetical protein
MSHLTFSENEIIIKGKKVPPFILFSLTFILIISALIPIGAVGFRVLYGMGFHFGLILSFLIFWGIAIYLTRILLWNIYGKEILTLKQDKITYIADYKYFKDGKKEVQSSNLNIEFFEQSGSDEKNGFLTINSDNNSIECSNKITRNQYDKIINKIETRYNII